MFGQAFVSVASLEGRDERGGRRVWRTSGREEMAAREAFLGVLIDPMLAWGQAIGNLLLLEPSGQRTSIVSGN